MANAPDFMGLRRVGQFTNAQNRIGSLCSFDRRCRKVELALQKTLDCYSLLVKQGSSLSEHEGNHYFLRQHRAGKTIMRMLVRPIRLMACCTRFLGSAPKFGSEFIVGHP